MPCWAGPRRAPGGGGLCARGGEAGQAGSRGGARRPPRQGQRWSRPAAAAGGDEPGGPEGLRGRAPTAPGPRRPPAGLPVNLTTAGSLSPSSGARGPAAAGGQEHPPLPGSAPRPVCGEEFSSPTGVWRLSLCSNPKCLLPCLPSLRRLCYSHPCRRVLPVSRCPGRELFIRSAVQTPT